jgi:hypothetical protein
MMIRGVLTIAAFGCALGWAPSGYAQAVAGVNIEVSECIELQSDLERYDCYERLTEAALSALASGEAPAPPSGQAVDSHASESSAPDEIRSSISALDERRPNEYLITLENGQIWRQSIAKRYPLRVGQDVRVYATRWGGSYRLSTIAASGFIQVERVR